MKQSGLNMILNKINSPADLKELDLSELKALSSEIRNFIVEAVEEKGGHLGSNLGVVELTIALHRVLNSPEDIILFDTGHQSYVHKILTGRKDQFTTLREAGGLSGYPSRSESAHDWIENSHASTALAYAHGLATAESKKENPKRVVAVIGDGALTGGMAFEGLNNLGHSNSDVTIIFNDNGRSYAPTVSLLSQSLAKIRANPVYMNRQRRLESFVSKIPLFGNLWHKGILSGKAAVREAIVPPSFFEPLGVRYMGPFDGHDVEELEEVIANAGKFSGPVVLHVLTQKGQGYAPAENDEVKNMHDLGAMKPGSYTEAFSTALTELAENNADVVAMTAAMPDSTGLLPFREKFPDRCMDVGIAEQHAVTSAAGMAMGGLRPFFAVYSTFLSRAFDQTNLDVGLHKQPVVFCLDRAGITGEDGPSHHGILDMVLLSKVPGMTMFCPSSYQELQQMVKDAYAITDGPCSIRWPKTSAPNVEPNKVGSGLSARLVREGEDVCIIGVGKMLGAAEEAAEILSDQGISVSVWDPRVVKPFDSEMLDHAAKHKLVITVEDGLIDGGVGSRLQNTLAEHKIEVRTLGIPTEYIPHGNAERILKDLKLDGEGIAETIKTYL